MTSSSVLQDDPIALRPLVAAIPFRFQESEYHVIDLYKNIPVFSDTYPDTIEEYLDDDGVE